METRILFLDRTPKCCYPHSHTTVMRNVEINLKIPETCTSFGNVERLENVRQ